MKKAFALVLGFVFILSLGTLASAQQPIVWKMQSTWTAADNHQVSANTFAEKVNTMSGGRLKIEVSAAGAIVPAFEVLDAVHKGILDAGHGWPGYWFGKHPACTLFSSVAGGPFGMDNMDFMAWMYLGGGLKMYNELLQNDLKMNVVVFPASGETAEPQGWFKKPIADIKTFKGLKFRAAGAASEVFKNLGMSVVILPGGEIVPALQRGVIDAGEFSDPSADMKMGFQDVAKYYYNPGVHQPTGFMEVLVNKAKWEALPADLKAIVENAAMATQGFFDCFMIHQNSQDMQTLITKHNVKIMETPREILMEVLKAWDKVAEKYVKENPTFAKIYASQKAWAERVVPYRRIAHPPYELSADYYWGALNPYKVTKAGKLPAATTAAPAKAPAKK
ncbi:MAG: TRAP transporter substrate-binding protein [Deltaproteobacteria bacterium]|nr:MAG: TRAP transporter substrate-binding protein [Deltaproteobacteria bacterium]